MAVPILSLGTWIIRMLALRAKGDWIKIKLNPSAAHSFTLDLGQVAPTDFLVWLPKTKFGLILNTESNESILFAIYMV